MPTRACTVGLRPKPTCSNIFVSARRRFTKWCSRLNAQASLQDSRAFPAASKCSLIRKTCRPYVDTEFIRSKSLRRGTRLFVPSAGAVPASSPSSPEASIVIRARSPLFHVPFDKATPPPSHELSDIEALQVLTLPRDRHL